MWDELHALLLAELHAADQLGWSKAVIDDTHVRALKGGPKQGRARSDRARAGSKHHLIAMGTASPSRCV
ncbi:hypothetical protein GCM10027176_36710 [Actinoallomurus bryophytorum]